MVKTSMLVTNGGDADNAISVIAIEATLANIWRREFGRKGQDIGAHIMRINVGMRRIIRFIEEVETNFGVKLPLTTFMRLGTIRGLASAIASGVWPEPSPLLLLRDGSPSQVAYVRY